MFFGAFRITAFLNAPTKEITSSGGRYKPSPTPNENFPQISGGVWGVDEGGNYDNHF